MIINYYTTISQSQKLIEIGLNPNTADMYYQSILPRFNNGFHHVPEVGNPLHALEWYNKGYTVNGKEPLSFEEFCIPCWTLDALIESFPFEDSESVTLGKSKDGKYLAELHLTDWDKPFFGENWIDCIVQAFEWNTNEREQSKPKFK